MSEAVADGAEDDALTWRRGEAGQARAPHTTTHLTPFKSPRNTSSLGLLKRPSSRLHAPPPMRVLRAHAWMDAHQPNNAGVRHRVRQRGRRLR